MPANQTRGFTWGDAFRLALALGIVWGLGMLIAAVVARYTAWYAHALVDVFASVYYGYGPSWKGALAGMVWGFLDAFIGTIAVVVVYRSLCCCKTRRRRAEAPKET